MAPLSAQVEVRWFSPTGAPSSRGYGVSFQNLAAGVKKQLEGLLAKWGNDPSPLPATAAAGTPFRVVLYESNPVLRSIYSDKLTKFSGPAGAGALKTELVCVSDPEICLEQLVGDQQQMAIIDLEHAPEASNLISRIRAAPGGDRIPVIILFSNAFTLPRDKYLLPLKKPIRLEDLFTTIRALLAVR